MRRGGRAVAGGLALLLALAATGRAQDPDPLLEGARAFVAAAAGGPEALAEVMAPGFRERVPVEAVHATLAELRRDHGPIVGVRLHQRLRALAGWVRLDLEDGARIRARLEVTGDAPARVEGMFLQPTRPAPPSWREIEAAFEALPGRAGVLVVELGGTGRVLAATRRHQRLGIASSFKLYVLGALCRSGRAWDEVVELDPAARSLPGGALRDWPAGAPVTLYGLAARMISQSDNTATDQLIHALGREAVEDTVRAMGHGRPARMRPVMTTRETFVLEGHAGLRARFQGAAEAERRALLEGPVAAVPYREIDPDGDPHHHEGVEAFASPQDLVRALDWLRTLGGPRAREVLGINPGADLPRPTFPYVGYKGGQAVGVLSYSWWLEDRTGRAWAVTGAWNREGQDIDPARFDPLFEAIFDRLAAEVDAGP